MTAKKQPEPDRTPARAEIDETANRLAESMFAAAPPPDPKRRPVKRLRPRPKRS